MADLLKCSICDSRYHYQSFCPRKPKKPIKRSYIKKTGKRVALNKETNALWLELNPPDMYGYWDCYLKISPHCLRRVSLQDLNIEHSYSKTRHPELRDKQDLLQPSCQACNKMKGSKDVDDFVDSFPHLRRYVMPLAKQS